MYFDLFHTNQQQFFFCHKSMSMPLREKGLFHSGESVLDLTFIKMM